MPVRFRHVSLYPTIGPVLKSNIKIVERGNIDTPITQIHDRSFFWRGTGTSIKVAGLILLLWTQTFHCVEIQHTVILNT